jgi:uncharacterized protein (TIGR02145 family)
MNANFSIYSCIFSVLMLTACSTEDINNGDIGVPLSIKTIIEGTRSAITSNTLSVGDSVGVFALNADGNEYSSGSMNMKSVCGDNNVWNFPCSDVYLKSSQASVYAYYPYCHNGSSLSAVPVSIIPNASGNQTDYLFGSGNGTVNCSQPEASITLHHALSRLTLSILRDGTGTTGGFLSDITLSNTSSSSTIALTGSMDVSTGVITPVQSGYSMLSYDVEKALDTTNPVIIDMMIFPTIINDNVELSLNIDSRIYRIKLPNMNLMAGKQIVLPITVSVYENAAKINSLSVVPWDTETEVKASVTTNDISIISPKAIDLGLSVMWADMNLGASTQDGYGKYFGWADPTGTKTSTTLADYPNASPPSSISGTSYDAATSLLGAWRIPTQTEMDELRTNCSWTWTSRNGVNGYLVTSKKTGYTDKSIFLPAAGEKLSGSTINAGTYCNYWTATLYADNKASAYYLNCNASGINIKYQSRFYGCSIRAVKTKMGDSSNTGSSSDSGNSD